MTAHVEPPTDPRRILSSLSALRALTGTYPAGHPMIADKVREADEAVQQHLARDGYLEATVDPETNFDRATSQAMVTFHVNRGPRAHVGQVVLEGNTAPFTQDEIIKQMKRGPGSASSNAPRGASAMARSCSPDSRGGFRAACARAAWSYGMRAARG